MVVANRTPLTLLPTKLRELTGAVPPGGYRACYKAVLDGKLPAEIADNGRISILDENLPKACDLFGLTILERVAA